MASSSITAKYIDDITECPVCTDVFKDPRVLPCIHTFCLKCIEDWGKTRQPEDKLACPLCRKEFNITEGKYSELPSNFFVVKLLEVKKLTSALTVADVPCDICKEAASESPSKANIYCIDCRQNMCTQCSIWHMKFKGNASHKFVEFEKHLQLGDVLEKVPENRCDLHPEKSLEIYCFDCQSAACMMCYITSHNSHKCSDVKKVADEMSSQIKSDTENVTKKAEEYKNHLKKIAEEETVFAEKLSEIEKQILCKAEELKLAIDDYKTKLIEELESTRKTYQKQSLTLKHEVEGRVLMMESFKRYSDELRNKGTPCDIARAAVGLNSRAKELMEFEVANDLVADGGVCDVKFSAGSLTDELKQIFGELEIINNVSGIDEAMFRTALTPEHIIPGNGRHITGVTTVGDEVFVVRYGSPDISVHDATTALLKRQLSVPNTSAHYGAAGCSTNKCIYVSDLSTSRIYRVDVSGTNTVTNWSVGSQPHGVSVNTDHNVLVACEAANKIQEFTTHGGLVREITPKSGITYPMNVIQLSSGQFGVTHYGSLHRYCVVGLDGQVIKSFGSSVGAGNDQLNSPYGLTVSKRGTVLIGDYGNSRVVVLNPSTFTATQLSIAGSVTNPFSVHIDESQRRLYVGEHTGQRRVLCLRL